MARMTKAALIATAFKLGADASRAEMDATKAKLADEAFFKAHATNDKRVPDHIEKAYKLGAYMAVAGLADTPDNRKACEVLLWTRGMQRDDTMKRDIGAVNARYSRRLRGAGLKGKDDRGTGNKPPKPDAPQATKPQATKSTAPQATAPQPIADVRIPKFVNEAEFVSYLANVMAHVRMTQKGNAKFNTKKIRDCVEGWETSHEVLQNTTK